MNIAIITGGESGEREVSINSAANIAEIIDFAKVTTFFFPEDKEKFSTGKADFDIVIPMIHGVGGEDGELQKYLESSKVPYLFSGPQAHEIGTNKRTTKEIANSLNIKTPEEIDVLSPRFPLFAKPINGGSSIASKICSNAEELKALFYEHPFLYFILETPITGREFTVGVVEKDGKNIPLPVIEIISKTKFFDYESKYDPAKLAEEVCPARISDVLTSNLQVAALTVHEKIGAKQISRSDFIVTENNDIYFLEINTIPGMTKTSLIPKMLNAAKVNISGLFKSWIDSSSNK